MIIPVFIFFFIGRAFASFYNFTNLAADVEICLHLIGGIIEEGSAKMFREDLLLLHKSLSDFSDALLQPKLLKKFCGNAQFPNPLTSDILNKYQFDTCNPFAERIDYRSLDQTKFVNSLSGFSVSTLKDNPLLAEEFYRLVQNKKVPLFIQQFDMTGNCHFYRRNIKDKLKKFIIRRIKEYAVSKNIEAPGKYGSYGRLFEDSIKFYIESGKPEQPPL